MKFQEIKSSQAHILVVDDDRRIRDLVSRFLCEHAFVAVAAADAAHAHALLQRFSFDALVVDVMMPGKTGVELTEEIRRSGNEVPVLLLTALGEAEDRISGLESGADDYLVKPFEPRELVLRLRAILRRMQQQEQDYAVKYRIGCWVFEPGSGILENESGEDEVRLTLVEENLLSALSESCGQPVSRDDLAQRCGLEAGERTIDVQVTRLRRKIEHNTKVPKYIQTIRGKGYMLRAQRV